MKFENLIYKKYEQIETAEGTKYRMTLEKVEEGRGLKVSLRIEASDTMVIDKLGMNLGMGADIQLKQPQSKLE